MKILVDEMPKEPKECPYSYQRYDSYWCYYLRETCSPNCDDTSKCKWFTELKDGVKNG